MIQQATLTINSDLNALAQVQEWFKAFCLEHGRTDLWLQNQLSPLSLALVEGFTNAVRHAHHELPTDTLIDIDVTLWGDRIEIRIWDHGQPFDPNSIVEPKPGTLQVGGYGWFLLRRLADQVLYKRQEDGRNCLCIVKHRVK